MATSWVETVKVAKGIKFRGRARLVKGGKVVSTDEKPFNTREAAKAWAKDAAIRLDKEQLEIEENGFVSSDIKSSLKEITIGELIVKYMEDPLTSQDMGRTKEYVLRAMLNYDISQVLVSQLNSDHLIEHCKTRLAGQYRGDKLVVPSPSTVYHDVTYLRSVIKSAMYFKVNSNQRYHEDAIPTLVNYKLIGRSNVRDRRPTSEELKLMEEMLVERQNHRSAKIPFYDILRFSLFTAMRVGEITKLLWSDLDHKNKTIIIRDRKDPRNKSGNSWEIPLLGESYEIIQRQQEAIDPERPEFVFPYNSKSVSAGWQRVRNKLGIKDLRYHDLRREAASRLAEQGYDIRVVAKITGHKNINILYNIYTALDMKKLGREEFEKYNKSD